MLSTENGSKQVDSTQVALWSEHGTLWALCTVESRLIVRKLHCGVHMVRYEHCVLLKAG
jgi:hypothetical protein